MSLYKDIVGNNKVNFNLNSFTKEEFTAAMEEIFSRNKGPIKYQVSGAILLYLSDEEFINIIKNGSENFTFMSGSEVMNKIQERIKKLMPDGK